MRKITAPAATFAIGLLLAGSIATAATTATSSGVKACADSGGNLTLRVKGHCPHGGKGVVINTGAVQGPAGATGAAGAKGDTGAAGQNGSKGDTGAPGDVSNVYTQAAADARFAPLKTVGNTLSVSGSDFHPGSSSTGYLLDADSAGASATTPPDVITPPSVPSTFVATLGGLPRNAVIQTVDFYVRHHLSAANATAGGAGVAVADIDPSTGHWTLDATSSATQQDIGIQKVTVNVVGPNNPSGLPISSFVIPQLNWSPAAYDAGEQIYGATVHYTLNG